MIIWKVLLVVLAVGALCLAMAAGFLVWQGSKKPDQTGEYVALGSSFAAGFGLGPRVAGSPVHCFRSNGGYPPLLAVRLGLRLVDMTCSGSTTDHILRGGQLFLGPQVDALSAATKLVTVTSGGNDVGYIGDLMAGSGAMGRMGKWWHGAIRPATSRAYGTVTENLEKIVGEVRKRAPQAEIVIINHPAVVPPEGTCAGLGISAEQAQISREVAKRLADATRLAATRAGVRLIDMAEYSAGHHACSDRPWVNGSEGVGAAAEAGAAFHPNAAGAAATAQRIAALLQRGR